jgi:hypothetical protein
LNRFNIKRVGRKRQGQKRAYHKHRLPCLPCGEPLQASFFVERGQREVRLKIRFPFDALRQTYAMVVAEETRGIKLGPFFVKVVVARIRSDKGQSVNE